MLPKVLLGLLFILTLFLEGSFVAIPLVLVVVLLASVIMRNTLLVFVVFVVGIVFDILRLNPLGQTSLFFVPLVVLITLYDRKFDTKSLPFIIFTSAISVSLYLLIFGHYAFFVELIISLVFAVMIYGIFTKLHLIKQESRS